MSPQDFRRIVLAHELVCPAVAARPPEPGSREVEDEKREGDSAMAEERERGA